MKCGLEIDEVTADELPFCAGSTLIIVGGYGTPGVDMSAFLVFLPTWHSMIRS